MLQKIEVTLTDAQIKALPTTGINIVAAPGAAKFIALILAYLACDSTFGNYTNIDANALIQLTIVGELVSTRLRQAVNTNISNLLATSDKAIVALTHPQTETGVAGVDTAAPSPNYLPSLDNGALTLGCINGAAGNFTGGNAANTMKVTVFYLIADL